MDEKDRAQVEELIELLVEKINNLINLPFLNEKQEAALIRHVLLFLLSLLQEMKLLKHSDKPKA